MKRKFQGDSHEAVKRLGQQVLAGWAPIYVEPRFIPKDLRENYTCLTGIPMLPDSPPDVFAILNHPDIGIRLPGENNQEEGETHISLLTIREQLHRKGVCAVITFDRGDRRHDGLSNAERRDVKIRYLADSGLFAFYYVAHSPFLCAFSDVDIQEQLQNQLLKCGSPEDVFEFHA